MRNTPNYHTACKLQDKILDMAGVVRQSRWNKSKIAAPEGIDLNPAQLSALVGAWDRLEERKRILRMKPMPKPVDVTEHGASRRRAPLPPPD
jgi:hypothetical protein